MKKLVVRRMMKSRYFSPSLILSPLGREDEGEGDAPSNKMWIISQLVEAQRAGTCKM